MAISGAKPGLQMGMKVSGAAIGANKIVQGDTTNTTNKEMVVLAATASTQRLIGITAEPTTAANEIATITLTGMPLCQVDGSGTGIDIGTPITATAAGVGIAAPTADATARYTIGLAMGVSAAAGDIIPVLIDRTTWNEPDQA